MDCALPPCLASYAVGKPGNQHPSVTPGIQAHFESLSSSTAVESGQYPGEIGPKAQRQHQHNHAKGYEVALSPKRKKSNRRTKSKGEKGSAEIKAHLRPENGEAPAVDLQGKADSQV